MLNAEEKREQMLQTGSGRGRKFFFKARRRDVVLSWRDFTVFVPGLLRTVGLWRWERKKEACLREGMKA